MRSRLLQISGTGLVAVALFCLAYPIYVIRPFRHQNAGELALALRILEWRDIVTVLCLLILAGTIAWAWRRALRGTRIFAVIVLSLTAASAALSRINLYEQMFHPLGTPDFEPAGTVQLAPDEKVLAVLLGNTARAYPVRGIAYHHIANDVVAGVPIVATY